MVVGNFRQRSTRYRHSLLRLIVPKASRTSHPGPIAQLAARIRNHGVMSHLAIPTRNPGVTTRAMTRVRNHGSISTLRHTANTPPREGSGTPPKPRRTMRVEMQVASPRATSQTQTPAASLPATLELKNSDPTQKLSIDKYRDESESDT